MAGIVVWLHVTVTVLIVIAVTMMHRLKVEVSLMVRVQRVRHLIGRVKLGVVHVVMLDTVDGRVLQVVEELVELMLDSCHHARTLVLINIVHGVTVMVRVVLIVVQTTADMVDVEFKVTLVRMLGPVRVLVMVPVVGLTIDMPVVRTMLDTMCVVVLIDMLWMVFTIVKVRVIVTKVMVSLWLHIVVLTMVLSREVTLVVEMRYMVFELPVALLEVGIGVMLVAVDELSHVRLVVHVSGLIRGHLVVHVILRREVIHGVVLASTLLLRLRLALLFGRLTLHWLAALLRRLTTLLLLRLLLLGLWLTVHLFVVEGGFWAQVLLSLGLGLRWLGMVVWILVMIRVVVVMMAYWRVSVRVWLIPLGLHRVVGSVRVSMSSIGIVVLIVNSVWITHRVVSSSIWVHSTVGRVAVRIVRVWHARVVRFSLHMAVVLLGANIVMLVTLLALLALGHGVLRGRLGPNWLDVSRLEGVHSVSHLWVIGLHLEHQITVLDIGLRGAEGGCVGIEGGIVRFVPSVGIECFEVVPPVEVEGLGLMVVCVGLHIVIHDVPRHILGVETFAPRLERWRPEVHHDGLWLCRQLDRRIVRIDATHLLVVNRVGNEIRRPLDLVNMPVILWVEALLIVMTLPLGVSIAIDHVHAEGVLLDRRHDLNVELVPPARVEVGPIPVSEERADCALLVWGLHARDEFTIGKLLKAGHGT